MFALLHCFTASAIVPIWFFYRRRKSYGIPTCVCNYGAWCNAWWLHFLDISNSVVSRAENQDCNTNCASTSQSGVEPAAIDCSHELQGKNKDQEKIMASQASHSFIQKINKTSFKRKATKDARGKGEAYIGYIKMMDGSIFHSVERFARWLGDRFSHND